MLDTALTNWYKREPFCTSSSGFLLEEKKIVKEVNVPRH